MGYFLCKLRAPRPTFPFDMTDAERALMGGHAGFLSERAEEGTVVLFGPVGDPAGPWGLAILEAADADAAKALLDGDPVVQSRTGFYYEIMPMLDIRFSPVRMNGNARVPEHARTRE